MSCLPKTRSMKPLPFLTCLKDKRDRMDTAHAMLLTDLDNLSKTIILDEICENSHPCINRRDKTSKPGQSFVEVDPRILESAKKRLSDYENTDVLKFSLLKQIELDQLLQNPRLPFFLDISYHELRFACCVFLSNLDPDRKKRCLNQLKALFRDRFADWCEEEKMKRRPRLPTLKILYETVKTIIVNEGRPISRANASLESKVELNNTRNSISSRRSSQRKKKASVIQDLNKQPHLPQSHSSINKSISRNEPYAFKILLFGESGVGKTTFINTISNYFNFETFESAQNGFSVTIDTRFTVTDDDMNPIAITMHSSDRNSKNRPRVECLNQSGESSTQVSHTYKLRITVGTTLYEIHIMDTPGINDTEGMKIDQLNSRRIVNQLKEIGYAHAICILMKPNEARLTSGIRYLLEEALHLHRNTAKNIFFCFTNSKDGPARSLDCLRTYLQRLQPSTNANIEATMDNIFWFDNSCFRYLCMINKRPEFKTEYLDLYNSILWSQNVKMAKKFFSKMYNTKAIDMMPTVICSKLEMVIEVTVQDIYRSSMHRNYNYHDAARLVLICRIITIFLQRNSLIFMKDRFIYSGQKIIENMNKRHLQNEADEMGYWLDVYTDMKEKGIKKYEATAETIEGFINELKFGNERLFNKIREEIGLDKFRDSLPGKDR